MRPVIRRAATAAAATAMLLGGAAAVASPASAWGWRGCTYNNPDFTAYTTTVNLRTGPGTRYTSQGLLAKNTRVVVMCHGGGLYWGYVQVKSGANAGKRGWIHLYYTRV